MTLRLLSLLSLLLLCRPLLADGFPFDYRSQRVHEPHMILLLKGEQIHEISSTGTITFNEEQLRLLRVFYPAATNRADVISATYNDNQEGLSDEDVFCFWVAPDQVAITLNEKAPKNRPPFEKPHNDHFPSDEELKDHVGRSIRLDPNGGIYYRGKLIALKAAFALIDEIASNPKGQIDSTTAGTSRELGVTLPPLRKGVDKREDATGPGPAEIFKALKHYGAAHSVVVCQSW